MENGEKTRGGREEEEEDVVVGSTGTERKRKRPLHSDLS